MENEEDSLDDDSSLETSSKNKTDDLTAEIPEKDPQLNI